MKTFNVNLSYQIDDGVSVRADTKEEALEKAHEFFRSTHKTSGKYVCLGCSAVEVKPEAEQPKLYVSLYHGRTDMDEEMEDWGTVGPVFGPYTHVQGTYAGDLKMIADKAWHRLMYADDLLYYDGVFYGDFMVVTRIGDAEVATFEPSKAELPPTLRRKEPEPMSQAEYAVNFGNQCPFCRSENVVKKGGLDLTVGSAFQDRSCSSCGKEWSERWKLDGFDQGLI